MPIRNKEGDLLGQFAEFMAQVEPNHERPVSNIPMDVLKSEIHRREEELPFIQLVEQIITRAESKELIISRERLVYQLHHDILGRPEMFIGYNISNLTLEQILEEDEKIKYGQIPLSEAQLRIVWSERFSIFEPGEVIPYHGEHSANGLRIFVDEFIERIGREKFRGKQEKHE